MKEQGNKADLNTSTGKPKSKHDSAHEVDPKHMDGKHDESLGRVGIAPAKPVWPSKK